MVIILVFVFVFVLLIDFMIYNNVMYVELGFVRYLCLVEFVFKSIDFFIGSIDGESLGVFIWGGDYCILL